MENENKFEYLERANRGLFENSRVIEASSAEAAEYYTKVPLAELYRAEQSFGIPVYRDEDSLLGVPYSHALYVGATGSGKTIYIINQILMYLSLPESLRPNLVMTDTKGELSDLLLELCRKGGYRDIILDCKKPFTGKSYNVLSPMCREKKQAALCHRISFALEKLSPEESPAGVISGFKDTDPGFAGSELARKLAGCRTAGEAKNCSDLAALVSEAECDKLLNSLMAALITVDDPKDRQWALGARNIMKGIISAMLELNSRSGELFPDELVTLSTAASFIAKRDSNGEFSDLADFLRSTDDRAASMAASYLSMNAKVTRDGYVAEAQTPMTRWCGPAIETLVSQSNHIDLSALAASATEKGKAPFVLFLKPNEDDPVTGTFLNIFTSDAVKEFKRAADAAPARCLDRPTLFILDEFANLGENIQGMDSFITTMRSRNVFFELFIQSFEQLDQSYGEKASLIIRQNCDTQVFLGTNSFATREAIARTYGMSARVSVSESVSQNGTNVNRSAQNSPNVHTSDLESMKLGELYVQSGRRPHLHSFVVPYFTLADNPVAPYYYRKPAAENYTSAVYRPVYFDLDGYLEKAKDHWEKENGGNRSLFDEDDEDFMRAYAESFLPADDPRVKPVCDDKEEPAGEEGDFDYEEDFLKPRKPGFSIDEILRRKPSDDNK